MGFASLKMTATSTAGSGSGTPLSSSSRSTSAAATATQSSFARKAINGNSNGAMLATFLALAATLM